jgi:hypothetical protein
LCDRAASVKARLQQLRNPNPDAKFNGTKISINNRVLESKSEGRTQAEMMNIEKAASDVEAWSQLPE